jgi:SAM-dependent methyltransferase
MEMVQGIRVEEIKSCFLCGGPGIPFYTGLRDRLFRVSGVWNLLKCGNCGLIWLNPRPYDEDVGKLYPGYFTHEIPQMRNGRWILFRGMVKRGILAAAFGYSQQQMRKGEWIAGRLLSGLSSIREIVGSKILWLKAEKRGSLLDVGCGNGKFLAQMRELGWEVMGLEPDPGAVSVAKAHFGLNVCQGTFKEVRLADRHFDVVTLNHVIEHVFDPIGMMKKCYHLLKPGGELVILTPNADSLGHRLFREFWQGFDLPRHLYLFSRHTLKACSDRAGLEVNRLATTASSARDIWHSSCHLKSNSNPGVGLSVQACQNSKTEREHLRMRHGSIPSERLGKWFSLKMQSEAMIFYLVEHFLDKVSPLGEDILMTVRKEEKT